MMIKQVLLPYKIFTFFDIFCMVYKFFRQFFGLIYPPSYIPFNIYHLNYTYLTNLSKKYMN